MRALSIICFLLGAALAFGGILNMSKPSVSPIVTMIGSFVLPAVFIWAGWIFHKKAGAKQ